MPDLNGEFLAIKRLFSGQPDNHIGWASSMPFASINPTNPRTNPWNFGGNCSAFGGGWKTQFFWVGHFEIFFAKKKFFFASFPSKLVNIYGIARIFQNFDDYPGFQKISGVPILLQHSVYLDSFSFTRHSALRVS